MQRPETATGHDHQPLHPEETSGEWAVAAYGTVLAAQPTGTTDIAYRAGVRFALGSQEANQQTLLELFAEQGVVRLTHLAEGVQVTLFHQYTAPTVTPEGLVFELPTPTR